MGTRLNERLLLKVIKNEQAGATLRQIQAKMKRTLKRLMSVSNVEALEIIERVVKFGHVQIIQAHGRKAARYQITRRGKEWLEKHPWSAAR